MQIIKTKILSRRQEEQITQLWNEEYPIKLADRFSLLLEGVQSYNHYIIEDDAEHVWAWAVDFEKDKEIRFSIIVTAQQKGKGLGKILLDKLKANNNEFYGWVIDHNDDKKNNGEYYQTPLPFYVKHGFEVLHNLRIDNEMLNAVKIKWKDKNNRNILSC